MEYRSASAIPLHCLVGVLADGFEYWINGESMGRGRIPVPNGGFVSLAPNPTGHAWAAGEKNAPFDQEVRADWE